MGRIVITYAMQMIIMMTPGSEVKFMFEVLHISLFIHHVHHMVHITVLSCMQMTTWKESPIISLLYCRSHKIVDIGQTDQSEWSQLSEYESHHADCLGVLN